MAYAFTPQIGYGGTIEVNTDYPAATYKFIDGLDDFDISFETSEIETTSRQNTTAGARNNASYLPGITRAEAHATFVGDPDASAAGQGHGTTIYPHLGITRRWRYTFADASTWIFIGFMSRVNFNSPREDKFAIDVTFRITGADTFTGDTD
jgi:hypothetical protein